METVNLLEIEMASRAHEDEEEKAEECKFSNGCFTQNGSGKDKQKPICWDYMTEEECKRGEPCSFQHPLTVGRCLRCGSTQHMVADCKSLEGRPLLARARRNQLPNKAETKAKEFLASHFVLWSEILGSGQPQFHKRFLKNDCIVTTHSCSKWPPE